MKFVTRGTSAACAVCGRAVGWRWYTSAWGDVWCTSHDDLPQCSLCGVPVTTRTDALCRACGSNAVRTRAEIDDPLRRVGAFMASIGLVVPHPTKLVLRDVGEFRARGWFTGNPDQYGVTRWQSDAGGRLTGGIEVGVASGLPSSTFRRVLAHELGHALLVGTRGLKLSPTLVEGFSESLSALYLQSCQGDRPERIELERLRRNPDPIYGVGYRTVAPAVRRHGPEATLEALRSGAPGRVGLR